MTWGWHGTPWLCRMGLGMLGVLWGHCWSPTDPLPAHFLPSPQKHSDDFDVVALWLANACRLLNCLRQYGRDEVGSLPPPRMALGTLGFVYGLGLPPIWCVGMCWADPAPCVALGWALGWGHRGTHHPDLAVPAELPAGEHGATE